MAAKRVGVLGASSGGIEALRTILCGLPLDFGAPICTLWAAVKAAIEDAIWNAAPSRKGRLLLEYLAAHAAALERVSLVAPIGAAMPHD